jgi:flavin reductase (DIM6/NTAB) family NADH-FMN oxidoreductase RutF
MSTHIGGSAHGGALDGSREADLDRAFRTALARWASGVTVVSVRDDAQVFGITATAFASVSLDPPLVLVCLGANAIVLPMLETGTQLVVSILGADQKRAATIFTDVGPLGRELFAPEGPPVLAGSLASLVCSVDAKHAAGDHTIIVARVHQVVLGENAQPLLRYERAWHTLAG